MALPGLNDIPKIFKQIGTIEKKLEKFAKNTGKAATDAAVKPVLAAVAALKKWVLGQLAELWKTVKGLGQKVLELGNRVAALEKRLNPLTPIATQATLIATHEGRLKTVEATGTRSAENVAKLKSEIRELKDAIKKLKKDVESRA